MKIIEHQRTFNQNQWFSMKIMENNSLARGRRQWRSL